MHKWWHALQYELDPCACDVEQEYFFESFENVSMRSTVLQQNTKNVL